MERLRHHTGNPWEARVAHCRALRVGAHVFVAGTVAVDEAGAVVGRDDLHAQTRHALRRIERALHAVGARMQDVVRTRTFVTDIARFDEFARAHRDVFAGIDPVATCVEVRALVLPELLVEIEVDAIVDLP